MQLVLSAFDWTEAGARLLGWAEGGQLHPGALTAGVTALQGAARRTDAAEVDVLEGLLAAGPAEARRLALAALVLGSQAPRSWTPQRLERLQGYRADPAVLVASAAQFTLPDAELEATS